jgi:hypothetical protein
MSDEPKNDWFGDGPPAITARRNATYQFWQKMQSEGALRDQCTAKTTTPKEASDIARGVLQTEGNFEKIPDDVEVRVFEFERTTADKIVTIVLPAKTDPPLDPQTFKDEQIWRCSWNLWLKLEDK